MLWPEQNDTSSIIRRLLASLPDGERYWWLAVAHPEEGFEANGSQRREVESWATRGTRVSAERAQRVLCNTEIIWGVLCGGTWDDEVPMVTITCDDGSWWHVVAAPEVIAAIASAFEGAPGS
jgi:hypothetical protein